MSLWFPTVTGSNKKKLSIWFYIGAKTSSYRCEEVKVPNNIH